MVQVLLIRASNKNIGNPGNRNLVKIRKIEKLTVAFLFAYFSRCLVLVVIEKRLAGEDMQEIHARRTNPEQKAGSLSAGHPPYRLVPHVGQVS